jgi:hypothetical protein
VYGLLGLIASPFSSESEEWREDKRAAYKRFGKIPNACVRCELLGLCRRPITKKGEVGKCYHGCLVINQKREEKG